MYRIRTIRGKYRKQNIYNLLTQQNVLKETVCVAAAMEVSVRQELNSLVEQLTHSGATELNQERMKKVKAICKLVYMHRIMKGVLKLHDRMLAHRKNNTYP